MELWQIFAKYHKYGENICYNSRDVEFLLRYYSLLTHPE